MISFQGENTLNGGRTRGIVNGDYFKVNKSGNVINLKSELKKDIKFDATVGGAFYGGFKYEYEKTFKAGITHSNGFKGYGNTEVKKDDPVTKVLDAATEAIKETQNKAKEALLAGTK